MSEIAANNSVIETQEVERIKREMNQLLEAFADQPCPLSLLEAFDQYQKQDQLPSSYLDWEALLLAAFTQILNHHVTHGDLEDDLPTTAQALINIFSDNERLQKMFKGVGLIKIGLGKRERARIQTTITPN